mmetsp:Transcript_3065/g.7986  ORF Transcript_3065/g.7986 Transcript_3065/m.7986 type:complete len:553 (-) Transcript_3065:1139-2797(-)
MARTLRVTAFDAFFRTSVRSWPSTALSFSSASTTFLSASARTATLTACFPAAIFRAAASTLCRAEDSAPTRESNTAFCICSSLAICSAPVAVFCSRSSLRAAPHRVLASSTRIKPPSSLDCEKSVCRSGERTVGRSSMAGNTLVSMARTALCFVYASSRPGWPTPRASFRAITVSRIARQASLTRWPAGPEWGTISSITVSSTIPLLSDGAAVAAGVSSCDAAHALCALTLARGSAFCGAALGAGATAAAAPSDALPSAALTRVTMSCFTSAGAVHALVFADAKAAAFFGFACAFLDPFLDSTCASAARFGFAAASDFPDGDAFVTAAAVFITVAAAAALPLRPFFAAEGAGAAALPTPCDPCAVANAVTMFGSGRCSVRRLASLVDLIACCASAFHCAALWAALLASSLALAASCAILAASACLTSASSATVAASRSLALTKLTSLVAASSSAFMTSSRASRIASLAFCWAASIRAADQASMRLTSSSLLVAAARALSTLSRATLVCRVSNGVEDMAGMMLAICCLPPTAGVGAATTSSRFRAVSMPVVPW